MSIRTNPVKAVPVLLKRVRTARTIFLERGRDESFDAKLETLTRELNKIKDLFLRVKKNEDELLDTLTEVDGFLRKLERKRLDEEMDDICKRIRNCAHKLLPMDGFDNSSEEVHKSSQIMHSQPQPSSTSTSTQHENQLPLRESYLKLEDRVRGILVGLSIFNQGVLKKRQTIYWLIGQGLVRNTREKTAEEVGEDVIHQLLKFNMILPCGNGKSPVVNKFLINPLIYRRMSQNLYSECLQLHQPKVILGDRFQALNDITSVFNVGASYLNFESQWLGKMKNLEVLQLGRWQDSPSHHIEVGSQEFLKELRNLKRLRYLSLRGISRISELHPSIAQHERLEILDLKACHNLETLPNDFTSMTSLTHLILSQCYLLEGMPKGIDKLTQLQVLKGFILGSSRKTPCRISDLANLTKLRRLSIHIGSEAVIEDGEFESLETLSKLEHLKISWGVSGAKYSNIQIILPSRLKKLHLECFPGQKIPQWLKPSKLPRGFKVLHITGGKLESMNHDEETNQWSMEIVRLKYLKHLKVDFKDLQKLFPSLRYAGIKQIQNQSDFDERSFD